MNIDGIVGSEAAAGAAGAFPGRHDMYEAQGFFFQPVTQSGANGVDAGEYFPVGMDQCDTDGAFNAAGFCFGRVLQIAGNELLQRGFPAGEIRWHFDKPEDIAARCKFCRNVPGLAVEPKIECNLIRHLPGILSPGDPGWHEAYEAEGFLVEPQSDIKTGNFRISDGAIGHDGETNGYGAAVFVQARCVRITGLLLEETVQGVWPAWK